MPIKKKSRTKPIAHLFTIAKRIYKSTYLDVLCVPAHSELLVVVISKKVGNAVTRNKIRRQIKAIFYEERLLEDCRHCIVIVKQPIVHVPFDTIKQLLVTIFNNTKDSP